MRRLRLVPLVTCTLAILAVYPASAQLPDGASAPQLELRAAGEMTMSVARMASREAVRSATSADSIWYDDGTSTPTSFVGYGQPTAFFAALRFTTTSEFTLTGLRMAYRTEMSTSPFTIFVLDASGGPENPAGGTILAQGSIDAPSQNGRFAQFDLAQPIGPFAVNTSFFVVVAFANVPFPMGTDDSGTGNYHGRAFFSNNGSQWTPLGDILGDGNPDIWKLRALGSSTGGGQQPQIAVSPSSISASAGVGETLTHPLTIQNTGQGVLDWSITSGAARDVATDPALSTAYAPGMGADDRDALLARAQGGDRVRVIVGLRVSFQPEGLLSGREAADQRADIAAARDEVLARLAPFGPIAVKTYETVPYFAAEVDAAGLAALLDDPMVVSLHEDVFETHHLAESIPIIGAHNAWSQGMTGSGQTIAVLDSGFQLDHPFFGGRGVAEACFSSNTAQSQSLCGNGQNQHIGPGSAIACSANIVGCDHGQHVAGIAMGSGPSFSGVAREANLMAVQVFLLVTDSDICGGSQHTPCVRTLVSDQIQALEWVYSQRNNFSIAAANMSLGGGQFQGHCDSDPRKPIIDNLRSVRIATVVASGNEGFTNAMGGPACISSAIAVGSTQDGSNGTVVDSVSPFSNSSSALDLLAPGQVLTSSVLNGGYGDKSGTSMAAPHVAGAFAVLRQQNPQGTVAQLLQALTSTGVAITDPRNGLVRSRIQLDAALGGGGGGWISVSPSTGTTSAGQSSQVVVTLNAAGLPAGTHTGSLSIASNDPNQPVVTVPVSLTITGGPPPPENILTHIGPNDTQHTFTTNVGGYVHGTNGYLDKAKAVAFELSGGAGSGTLTAVNVYFSARAPTPVLQSYHVRIYDGTPASGPQGSPLHSQTFLLENVLVGNPSPPTEHVLSAPVTVGSAFFVTVEYPDSYAHEDFNIASTAALGSASAFEWEMWEDGTWHNMSDAWFGNSDGWHMWIEAVMGGSVSDEPAPEGPRFALASSFPNPVSHTASIEYSLAEPGPVRLEVFDLLGRRVARLVDEHRQAGLHSVTWDASTASGGVYHYRLTAGADTATRRLVVVR